MGNWTPENAPNIKPGQTPLKPDPKETAKSLGNVAIKGANKGK